MEAPRDRDGSFELQLVKARQRRLTSIDGKILSLYVKRMATCEIVVKFEEIYGVEVSPSLMS